MTSKIWLIAEDETDRQVFQRIFDAKGLTVRVEFLEPAGNSGGISRLAHQLENLIRTANARRGKNDCIVVFHDADECVQPDRASYEKIKNICEKYRDIVVLIIACDEIESWLLADEGLCKWIGIRPRNCDNQQQPSSTLSSTLQRKKKPKYKGRYRGQVLAHVDGTGDKLSPSMKQAMQHLNAHCFA